MRLSKDPAAKSEVEGIERYVGLEHIANSNLAEEVLYRLRAIVLSVRSDQLIRANEEFTTWLRGNRNCPGIPAITVDSSDTPETPIDNRWTSLEALKKQLPG